MKHTFSLATVIVSVALGVDLGTAVEAAELSFLKRNISKNAKGARSVFAVDLDGDGDIDVLSASANDDKVAWYENDGAAAPTLTEHVVSTNADGATSIFAADVDGDGDWDILSASENNHEIAWYENDGASPPTFAKHLISVAAGAALCVFAKDVDGDGDMDVLSASAEDGKVAWYENDGASSPVFTEWVISTSSTDWPTAVFAADIDGDGDTDVVSTLWYSHEVSWYENDGGSPPTFAKHVLSTSANGPRSVFAADVDADGDLDVLSASEHDQKLAWYRNDGGSPPVFVERVVSMNAHGGYSVSTTDVDGDGDADVIAAARWDDKIAWYENDGASNPSFVERVVSIHASSARAVFGADLDDDGDTDLLSASDGDDKIAWYENSPARGPIRFDKRVISDCACGPASVLASDVNGDGDIDVLSASYWTDTLAWYDNDGDPPPTFTERIITTNAMRPRTVVAADIDGDGDTDAVSGSWDIGSKIAWYENDGGRSPTFAEHVILSSYDRRTFTVAAADLDGDGDMDVLSGSEVTSNLAWHENDGSIPPVFSEHVISNTIGVSVSIASGDLDGDGDVDVVSAEALDDRVTWYENDGVTPPGFIEHVIASDADYPQFVYVTDVDLDGDPDVLAAIGYDEKIVWYENEGGAPPSFRERIISTGADWARSVSAADVDGDGDIDVLSASSWDDKFAWYENDGGSPPVFTEWLIGLGIGARSIVARDVDGDGDTDVMAASFTDNTIALYENMTCGNGQVDAGEECDEGGETANCDLDCTIVECGDGTVNATAGEACDGGFACTNCVCDPDFGPTEPPSVDCHITIPATTEWGMLVMVLVGLCIGSIVFAWHHARSQVEP